MAYVRKSPAPPVTVPRSAPAGHNRAGGSYNYASGHSKKYLLIAAGLLLAIAAAVIGIRLIQQPAGTVTGRIAVLLNLDQNTAGNGIDEAIPAITSSANDLAESGGGDLYIVAAAGGAAVTAAHIDLSVTDADGNRQNDDATRHQVIADRITKAFSDATSSPPTENGRNVLDLLRVAATLVPPPGQLYDVFYIGLGLATSDPIDARVQMPGMEPSEAINEVATRLPKLPGARLHLVFPAAAGNQPAFNSLTDQWRSKFWTELAMITKSRVVSTDESNAPAPAAAGSPAAPIIPNLADFTQSGNLTTPSSAATKPTTHHPKPPSATSTPDPTPTPTSPPKAVVLGAAAFQPDSPQWVDQTAAAAALKPLANAWAAQPSAYTGVTCLGRTADYGPADTALLLSRLRAQQAEALLVRLEPEIPVTSEGLGYSQPIAGFDPKSPYQRSVTCTLHPDK